MFICTSFQLSVIILWPLVAQEDLISINAFCISLNFFSFVLIIVFERTEPSRICQLQFCTTRIISCQPSPGSFLYGFNGRNIMITNCTYSLDLIICVLTSSFPLSVCIQQAATSLVLGFHPILISCHCIACVHCIHSPQKSSEKEGLVYDVVDIDDVRISPTWFWAASRKEFDVAEEVA